VTVGLIENSAEQDIARESVPAEEISREISSVKQEKEQASAASSIDYGIIGITDKFRFGAIVTFVHIPVVL
jgi:hypothetical protein